jgi:competence protein ComEC
MIALAANGHVRGRSARVAKVNTENERSLSFLVQYKGFHYLISGDLIGRDFGQENAEVEKAVGEFLEENGINVDVLHVNHHGGNNGSEAEFLELIAPEIAIISLGNGNPHHHPNSQVLERLASAGVTLIYQTEWGTTRGEIPEIVRRRQAIFQGDIIITTDGKTFEISTSRSFEVDDD